MQTLDTKLISNVEFLSELIRIALDVPVVTNNKKEKFLNIPAGVDIETSSFYQGMDKVAIMYEWTFGIGYLKDGEFKTMITYGRTWEQYMNFIDWISEILSLTNSKTRLVVYVHNLPYEWQFMRRHFSWTKVFFMDDRKPVYCIDAHNIEYRCSLKLSGKSLANTAKDLLKYQTEKMVGDLDYNLIRHPETPLTERELKYCEHDIAVILAYIQEKIEQEGDITKIPLTKTGYVRRYCKRAMFPQGKVLEDENTHAEINFEAVGVSRTERMFSRWLYPRQCSPSRDDSYESWFIRLYEQLSSVYGSFSVSDGHRKIHR